jgi:hypothetical protein
MRLSASGARPACKLDTYLDYYNFDGVHDGRLTRGFIPPTSSTVPARWGQLTPIFRHIWVAVRPRRGPGRSDHRLRGHSHAGAQRYGTRPTRRQATLRYVGANGSPNCPASSAATISATPHATVIVVAYPNSSAILRNETL